MVCCVVAGGAAAAAREASINGTRSSSRRARMWERTHGDNESCMKDAARLLLLPLPRYSGGEGRATRAVKQRGLPESPERSLSFVFHAHRAPLPCPLPGVPVSGSKARENSRHSSATPD